MLDAVELNHQYRQWRSENDSHFAEIAEIEFDGDCAAAFPEEDPEDVLMELTADWADAADHLRRFIIHSAKKMGIPNSERDDVASDALLEITVELGRDQFDLLLESVHTSDRIVAALRDSERGLKARRAIKRSLARFQFPDATFTDIGMYDESPHGS